MLEGPAAAVEQVAERVEQVAVHDDSLGESEFGMTLADHRTALGPQPAS